MGSRILGASPFVVRVALRAVLIGVLACGAIQLLLTTHLYATALVIIGLASVVIADLGKIVGNADHSAERSLESLTAEGGDMPLLRVSAPAQRAARLLQIERAERQQQLDYQQTLLDTVAAALIVVRPDDRVTLANRAARSLAASSVDRLQEIAAIGTSGAQQLLAIAPGRRQIVSLDGRPMFVSVSQFSIPGRLPQRLISLQRIAGELDAIELKAWRDVVHVLAHEMMNSLTPISSLSESLELLLQTSDSREEIAGALEAIKRRSLGLMDFVERYRKLAELPTPEPRRIRADDFLSGIDRLMSGTFREKRIAYRSRITPGDLSLSADPQLLEQAMINLLRNAAEAVAGLAQPRIDVSCQLREEQLIITIADNGTGLPAEKRDQVFVPFFTTKPGGSGIGLSIARQVALAHGGQLDASANEPCGTVFTLVLPASPQA
jgi:two-component system, NtrC family, nitrogen regulation sensor histidine kinase NtrY